jgi:hypothetical protein
MTSLPSRATKSFGSTFVPSVVASWLLTVTRPAVMSVSA